MKRDKIFQKLVIFIFVSVLFSGLCSAADYCIFYEHTDGKGAYLKSGVGNSNSIGKRWNDMISSVWIQDGYKVTIYEHTDFKGKSYALYGERGGKLYNLTDIGFNDMISSYAVDTDTGRDSSVNVSDSSVCCKFYEHTNAQGSSFSSGAGNSNFIGNRWNDKISSVWVGEGYKVTIYENTGFGGKSQTLYGRNGGSLYNLTDISFNDMISSYSAERDTRDTSNEQSEVSGGNAYCKFYEHTDGSGKSFSAGLGNRNSLDRRWNDRVSSVWVQEGYSVTIYENNNFGGKSYRLYGKQGGTLYNLTDIGFNDMLSSYSVEKGGRDAWNQQNEDSEDSAYCKFYEHTDGSGKSFSAGLGNRNSLDRRWDDRISSVWVQQGYSLTIYENNNFGGKSYRLYGKQGGTLYNLTDISFNDMLSSYIVEKGGREGKFDGRDRDGKYDGRDTRRDENKNSTLLKKYADSKRQSGAGNAGDNVCCKFYEHTNGEGDGFSSGCGSSSSVDARWNDKISSVWVKEGTRVTIYENNDFRGRSYTLQGQPGGTLYNLTDLGLNDMVSSYKAE